MASATTLHSKELAMLLVTVSQELEETACLRPDVTISERSVEPAISMQAYLPWARRTIQAPSHEALVEEGGGVAINEITPMS